jgi:hypothetical protein
MIREKVHRLANYLKTSPEASIRKDIAPVIFPGEAVTDEVAQEARLYLRAARKVLEEDPAGYVMTRLGRDTVRFLDGGATEEDKERNYRQNVRRGFRMFRGWLQNAVDRRRLAQEKGWETEMHKEELRGICHETARKLADLRGGLDSTQKIS